MPATTHDFGSLQVGQTSAAYTFTINPAAGNNSDVVNSITENCPDFSVNAPGLPFTVYRTCETCTCPANGGYICPTICCTTDFESYSFDTYFSPTVGGTVSCTVTITLDNGATTKLVTLNGTGTLPPVQISVQPSSVNFGDVRRNTDSTPVGINVSNTGGQTLTVSSVSVSAGFTITSGPTGQYDVGVGSTQPYTVVCHPTATGTLSGMFTVNSNDTSHSPLNVPLTCNGIDSNLTINPSPVSLPTTRVGEPVQATVQLVNSGAASMTIENVSVSGQDLSMIAGPGSNSLAGGGSTTLTVGFAAASKEEPTGSLVVTYDGGQQRTAQLLAHALATSMAVTPDGDIDFGPVCSGQTATEDFAIVGNDEGSFKVTTISAPAAPFTVTAPTLPATVQGAGANQVMFTVTAAPTASGQQVSTIMVDTDIPGGTPHMINLAVEGLTAGVSATPDSLDFGSSQIETTTIGQEVHLSNCSTSAITAMNARIEGTDSADFAIVQQPDNAIIQPTQFASWLVVLQAHTPGPKQASFVVDYDGGTAMVPLAGEGLSDAMGSGSDAIGEKSYYSCAAGGGSGTWPIVLGALAFVVRRRRRRAA
jgi:MYXO-CTERM domain-containing protein